MELSKSVWVRLAALGALCAPIVVFAQDVVTQSDISTPIPHGNTLIVLHSAIGVFGAASLVAFLSGLGTYFARLGLENRLDGIRIMEWGVRLLVTVIFLIGLLRFLTLYWWA